MDWLREECDKVGMKVEAVKRALANRPASELKRRAALKMRAAGLSFRECAEHLGYGAEESVRLMLRSATTGPIKPEQVQEFFRMKRDGITHREIAQMWGMRAHKLDGWSKLYRELMKPEYLVEKENDPIELAQEYLKEECAKVGMDFMWCLTTENVLPAVEVRRRVARRLVARGWSTSKVAMGLGYATSSRICDLVSEKSMVNPSLTPENVSRMFQLRRKGMRMADICKEMGLNRKQADRWVTIYMAGFKCKNEAA